MASRRRPVPSDSPALTTSLSGTSIFAIVLEIPPRCQGRETPRNFLDYLYGILRIPPDRPRPANFQPLVHHGRIPGSSNRIPACRHVYPAREAPAKICFDYLSLCPNPGVGHPPRKQRLGSEAKALIQTGKPEAGNLRNPPHFPHLFTSIDFRVTPHPGRNCAMSF